MTDDPFLNPNPGGMRPAEPSGQPSAVPPPTAVQPSSPPPPMPAYQPTPGYPPTSASQLPPPPPAYGQQYAQPGYSGYASPPNYYGASYPKNWLGIASLICSLATLMVGISVIPGIIFGHMGLAAAKRGEANNRGLSLAGLIIGYVFLLFGLLLIVGLIVLFSTAPDYTYDSYETY